LEKDIDGESTIPPRAGTDLLPEFDIESEEVATLNMDDGWALPVATDPATNLNV